MTVAKNDITGDRLVSKGINDKYLANFDRIFGPKEVPVSTPVRFKDSVKLGVSPSTTVFNMNCTKKGGDV
jgi:hypothetical protein